jgi:hypothetical protein
MAPFTFNYAYEASFLCFTINLMDQAGTTGLSLSPISNIVFDFSTQFKVAVGAFPNGYIGSNVN